MIDINDYSKVIFRIGTIINAKENKKARKPAYALTIDFGKEIGIKKSSAQITELYKTEDLIGKQVVCCVNLTPLHIGDITSEVRIMGALSNKGVVLLTLDEKVENGSLVD